MNSTFRDIGESDGGQPLRYKYLALAILGLVIGAGCSPENQSDANTTAVDFVAAAPEPDELKAKLDRVLDYTLQQRRLNVIDHGAWQILHGVLAYQQEFPVQMARDGESQSAVEYILNGGVMQGWTVQPGDLLDAKTGRRGLRAIVEPGTKKGQGHADQWLAILAQCGLPPEQEFKVGQQTFTMADFVEQVKLDLPRNVNNEWSWTLIGLTTYMPTDATWVAGDGQEWSIERMVQGEIEQDVYGSACGGTHRLIGVAMTLNQHLANGGKLTGAWKAADETIQKAIEDARLFQNEDGSFSTQYFRRPGRSSDMAIALSTTGHILEFLVLAMNDEQLRQPWVSRAASNLCDLFLQTQDLSLECGALYHATHGLVLYRDRAFGTRDYTAQLTSGS